MAQSRTTVSNESSERFKQKEQQREILTKRIDVQLRWAPVLGWAGFILGFILYILGWVIYGTKKTEMADLGTFLGGAVSSVWSASGLALVYSAFLGQRRQLILQEIDLDLQREELRASRLEMNGQRQALEEQANTARLQQASTIFFNLLHHYSNMVNSVVYKDDESNKLFYGRDAIDRAIIEANKIVFPQNLTKGSEIARSMVIIVRDKAPVLGVLIRNLDLLMKYADNMSSKISQEYIDALNVQLSPSELNLWIITCFGKRYGQNRKIFTEKYGLLRDHKFFDEWKIISSEFKPSAFERPIISII